MCETFNFYSGRYLDCTNRFLSRLPNLNYYHYDFVNLQKNFFHWINVSQYTDTLFDLRDNPITCENIIRAVGQIVYPCETLSEADYYDSDPDSHDKSDNSQNDGILALKIIGWIVFVGVFLGLIIFAGVKIYRWRRRKMLGGLFFFPIVTLFADIEIYCSILLLLPCNLGKVRSNIIKQSSMQPNLLPARVLLLGQLYMGLHSWRGILFITKCICF